MTNKTQHTSDAERRALNSASILEPQIQDLQRMLDSLPMGLLGLDLSGVCLMINQNAADMLLLDPLTTPGQSIAELNINDSVKSLLRDAIDHATSDRPLTCELSIRDRYYDIRTTIVREDGGGEDHIMVLFEDLSKKRIVEQKKDEFLALISHELRTPLTVIKGYLEIMGAGMMGDVSDQQKECIQTMHENCTQLETLIRDLIRFGMLSRGEVRAAPETITLYPFLKNFARSQKKRLLSARLELSLVVPDPLITCLCDGEHLRDILRHLVDNAIKFSGDGSSIKIGATVFDPKDLPSAQSRIIRDNPSPHKQWVKIEVEDNGKGIPAERINDIFNSFEQVENYMTRESRGMGIGLAFVKEIIKSYEGSLWIESRVGRGTNVALLLPRIDRKEI